jgi:hypothetical protein
MSTSTTAHPLDTATQARLLAFYNAAQPGSTTGRTHLSDSDPRTNHFPSAAPDGEAVPVPPQWAPIARDLLAACTFRTLASAEQTTSAGGRTETAAIVHVSILKPGHQGTSWAPPKACECLVSLTRASTPGRTPPTELAAHVHVLDGRKLAPVLVAKLDFDGLAARAEDGDLERFLASSRLREQHRAHSFLVKAGNRALAAGQRGKGGL